MAVQHHHPEKVKTWGERFDRLSESVSDFECAEVLSHDRSRAGGDPTGRWAVLAQGNDGKLLELTRCSSPARGQVVAESHIREGWAIRGLYDLDTLIGGEYEPREGDRVTYCHADDPEHVYYVTAVQSDTCEGEYVDKFYLDDDQDAFLDAEHMDLFADDLAVVEMAEPDDRLPVKYDVAGMVTTVIFNTVPST